MKRLDGITNSRDMNLSKLGEMVEDREAWHVAVHGIAESNVTQQLNNNKNGFENSSHPPSFSILVHCTSVFCFCFLFVFVFTSNKYLIYTRYQQRKWIQSLKEFTVYIVIVHLQLHCNLFTEEIGDKQKSKQMKKKYQMVISTFRRRMTLDEKAYFAFLNKGSLEN